MVDLLGNYICCTDGGEIDTPSRKVYRAEKVDKYTAVRDVCRVVGGRVGFFKMWVFCTTLGVGYIQKVEEYSDAHAIQVAEAFRD